MPEQKQTNALIIRLTEDYIKSIRARRLYSIVLIAVGIVTITLSNFVFHESFESVLKLIASATGLTVSASSFFPINDVIKLNLKIRTLKSLSDDLTNDIDASDEDTKRIEQIVWKLVEQTVTA